MMETMRAPLENHRPGDSSDADPGDAPRHLASTREAGRTHQRHSHDPLALEAHQASRIRLLLALIVVPLVVATLVGMVLLWPSHTTVIGSRPFIAEGVSVLRATIVGLDPSDCVSADTVARAADTGLLDNAVCGRLDSGAHAGTLFPLHLTAESRAVARLGDAMSVLENPVDDPLSRYIFLDFSRALPIGVLVGAYVLLILLVAGRKGLRALLGLALSLAVLTAFMIPALLEGTSPLWVTLVGAMSMILAAIYIAHGVSVRTTTALLGTVLGVGVTVTAALWGVDATRLDGSHSEEAVLLANLTTGIHLPALITCGIVIVGLGVLNDVTITQASAVWELHAADPTMRRSELFASAMTIGRDHIASTVYTLAFAYTGSALSTILAAALIDRSVLDTLTSGILSEDIVCTLISSIGLVLVIPLTTVLATFLCTVTSTRPGTRAPSERPIV